MQDQQARPNDGAVTQLLRARNQEIGQLHQQLQTKSQLEQQHKQSVDQLKKYTKQMEIEVDTLKRYACEELHVTLLNTMYLYILLIITLM